MIPVGLGYLLAGGVKMAVRKRTYKDGSFRYMLDWYDQNGIRRRETLPDGTTLKAAKETLRKYEEQACKGIYIPESENILFEKVADDWLQYKKPNIRASTWSVTDGHVRNHMTDFYGIQINKITIAKIEKWISDKREAGTHILTLRKILTNLKQIFSYAFRHKYIPVNPMLALERLKAQGETDTTRKMNILNPEQIKALLDAVSTKQKYHTLFMLAIFSGARQGELLGLRWTDILWDSNQISISRTFNNGRFYDAKTSKSIRKIDLGAEMMLALKKWKVACPPNDLVFPNDEGNPISNKNMMNRHFFPALKKAGIQDIRFHDLRHTYASLKIHQGANIKYIQMQMGHAKATITLDVYAHLLDESNPNSAQELENMVLG